ncbi:MAG: MMPL family transporter [Sandaracinaceae bacterium]|nr:MMPL family transporter [Sandaracinaceae bacterium]
MDRLLERLARSSLERPVRTVLVAALLALIGLGLVLGLPPISDGLTLNSDFTAMLPRSAQSVRDFDEISARFGGQQALIVTVESPSDIEAARRFTRDLVPRIEAMRALKVAAVDWNLSDFERFVDEHGHLYASREDLEAIRDTLAARLEHERARANPFYVDLDDPPPDPEETIERIRRDAERARGDMHERFPEGFFQHPSENLLLFVVHTSIRGGEIGDTQALVAAIRAAAADLGPASYAPDLRLSFGGTLMEAHDETLSLVAAVRNATLLTIALVMLAIWVFFLRVRPIPLLTLALVPPVLVTFGVAELTVDYLNASSAFLSAIVVGNGINPNVIWLARFFEARRAGEPLEKALVTSHVGTWKGTLAASLAAGVAYGSLMTTDYRGFRDFGIVGGTGMVLCWIAAYTLLPALTVLFERWRPLVFDRGARYKGIYGVIFARVALGSPRAVLALSALVTIGCGVLVAIAIAEDPLEYDYRRLRSDRDPEGEVERVLAASRVILDDTSSGSGLAVLAPTRAAALAFRADLEARRGEWPNAYGAITSIDDLLPEDQDAKLPIVAELRRLMLEIRPHVSEELQRTIDERIPPEGVAPLGPDDLPRSVARPFTERDGTRGRLFVIEHHPEESGWDGLYTARWAAAARSLRAPGADGPPPVAGTAVVFSDLMQQIWDDGPRSIGVALLATVLLLAFTFRDHRSRWLTLATLLVGIVWMAGTMAAFGMHLNFLNFVAFPITFGNGADYGVNVMQRYTEERRRGGASPLDAVRAAVEGTGGAVVLCSLTTIIGYISIYTSSNQALNSFGAAMAISEVTCLAVAVLALPASLHLMARPGAPARDARAASV